MYSMIASSIVGFRETDRFPCGLVQFDQRCGGVLDYGCPDRYALAIVGVRGVSTHRLMRRSRASSPSRSRVCVQRCAELLVTPTAAAISPRFSARR
jgi:hypothetical protein